MRRDAGAILLRFVAAIAVGAAGGALFAGVGALALNHLIPSDDPDYTADHWHEAVRPHWSGGFHLGRDGLRIPL